MENIQIIITAILAGLLTYFISIKLEKGAVFGSAVVVLLSGLFLPHFFENGSLLAVVATTASYAGMVAGKNVPNLVEMGIVGLITGVVFILAQPVYLGVGGKLGVIGAIACLTWIGMKKAYQMTFVERKEKGIKRTASRMQ